MWPGSATAMAGCASPVGVTDGSWSPRLPSMFTVCPKCALTLVVTAADLRIAQGYVRCGRCSSVFNALAQLTDERPPRGVASEAEEAPSEADGLSGEAPDEFSSEADELSSAAGELANDADELSREAEDLPGAPEETFVEAPARLPGAAPESAQSFIAWPPPQRSTPVEAPDSPAEAADEDAIPEDALEFHPATTDVMAVFVEPPPNPDWAAATGSFRAMIAANPEPAQKRPTRPVDVEIDSPHAATTSAATTSAATTSAATAGAAAVVKIVDEHIARATPSLLRRAENRDHGTRKTAEQSAAAPTGVERRAEDRDRGTTEIAGARAAPTPPHVEHRADARDRDTARIADGGTAPTPPSVERPADERDHGTVLAHLRPYLWHAAAVVALLALLAQIVHHNRDELAASASFSRPLTALYAALGMPLVPRWDLHAYDVRQLGAAVDPASGGLMTVRASIRNSTQQRQPLPLLRVTLEDRFGNRIASRDVAPRFYLPQHGAPVSPYLAGGQRIDAEMGFADPGTSAVGFEIDACLPARGGGVTCANDVAAR
jgi:predicted Zn finger-like uncharacterized protein